MTPPIVWFTGLPASGKSTLAARVRDRLRADQLSALVLDSDELRDALGAHAYDDTTRDAFYRALANLAALVARQGIVPLVAATAPRRAHRDFARATGCRVLEVFVATPLPVCEARDPKGLYAAARSNPNTTLPGVGVPFEAPEAPDVISLLDTDATEEICTLLRGDRRGG